MEFEKVTPYGPDGGVTHWIAGIYKITKYRRDEYYAYYLVNGAKNWGNHVSKPPGQGLTGSPCWLSLSAAIEACAVHAMNHTPARTSLERAAHALAELREQEKKNSRTWRCIFTGKRKGALGLPGAHALHVVASDPAAARLACYENHEHILNFKAIEVTTETVNDNRE